MQNKILDLGNIPAGWQNTPARPNPSIGGFPRLRQHAIATLLATGDVFVSGGYADPGNEATAVKYTEIFREDLNAWREGPSAVVGRNYHSTALLLPDGRVWTAGANKRARLQIARLAGLQGDVARASALLDAVERSAGEEPPAELRARLLLERGRLLNSQDRPLEARPLFEQAHTLAVRARLDALDVDALHMVAITHLGDPEQALAWDLRALALAESSADARARQWLAVLYNNIGYSYDDQGDYARALELFEKALVLRIAAKKPGPTALAHYAVAHAQRELGRIDVARARLLPLLRELEASGAPAGHVLEELGECELAAGRSDAARPYFARAHAELSRDEWVREHEPSRLARLAQLAGTTATQP